MLKQVAFSSHFLNLLLSSSSSLSSSSTTTTTNSSTTSSTSPPHIILTRCWRCARMRLLRTSTATATDSAPCFVTFWNLFFPFFLFSFWSTNKGGERGGRIEREKEGERERESEKERRERARCELNWTRCWSHVSRLGPGCTERCTGAFSQPVPPKALSFFSPSPPSWGLGNIHSIRRNPPHQ